MSSDRSVSHWIAELRAGNHAAAQQLWEEYFQRLVGLARKRLRGQPRRAADEEDVALSAFDSFCRGAENGRFPQLSDRQDLWRLLVVITARKASHLVRNESRQKRGGGAVRGESALLSPRGASGADSGFAQIIGREPTSDFAAQVAEECGRLLDCLGDDDLRLIALAKMEGHTTDEIAARLGCARCTVERRLRLIRRIWEKETAP
jgi:DNA-directed RNA polymerase specialized sigma24 family protein